MRQLTIQTPRGGGRQVLDLAAKHEGSHMALTQAVDEHGALELVSALIPNRQVGDFLAALEKALPEAEVALLPSAVLSMRLPTDEIPQALTDTQPRSPVEVFLGGVQSIGSWQSFLIYAVVAGIIVWIGLYTNSVFLLVASMLIAPFGGPAMNVGIASARGDLTLIKRSVLRYMIGLLTMIAVTLALSLLFGQSTATAQMVSASEVSATAVLLPLAGGVAGALQLVQSERSSLVSGTAIGMLVAAALAPPAGMVGMAIAVGMPEMAINGVFLLLLQLVGINIACAVVFRLYGLRPSGPVYARGRRQLFPIAMAFSGLALALLLGWQFVVTPAPDLLRSSRAQRAVTVIKSVIDNDPYVALVESDVSFTRASIPGQNTLLSNVYIQPREGQDIAADSTTRRLTEEIQREILAAGFNVTPLVNVTLLEPLEE
ncbi:MAG: DUF389 domain-containing protein [Cyanobacteria bacterium J06607_13]